MFISLKSFSAHFLFLLLVVCPIATHADKWASFCESTDWRALGLADGNNGESLKAMKKYKKRCKKTFTKNEIRQYERGYLFGIQTFCTYDNGYDIGYKKHSNPKSCPFEIAGEFDRGFMEGRAKFRSDRALLEDFRRGDGVEAARAGQQVGTAVSQQPPPAPAPGQ